MTALRTFVNVAAGVGGFQRSGPTGGAAYGIPLKLRMAAVAVPRTGPNDVTTTLGSMLAAVSVVPSSAHDAKVITASAARKSLVREEQWVTIVSCFGKSR